MTAVLAYLRSLSAWDWVCIWLGISPVVAVLIGRMIRRADETEQPAADVITEPEPLFVTVLREWERPPVPESVLTPRQVARLCRQIETAEGWAA